MTETTSPVLWFGCALGAAAVCVLRAGWSLTHRSVAWNGAGWLLLVFAVMLGGRAGGAWGMSIVGLVTTSAAFVALTIAGVRSPQGRAASSNRRAGMLAQPGEPLYLWRRTATFLLVVPGGFVASIMLAVAIRGLGVAMGWREANANVAAFYMVPLAWSVLATVLLMQTRRGSQSLTLIGCGLVSAPFVLTGLAT